MKRNENRMWYDKGYSDGSKEARKNSIIPRALGLICLSALLVADQYWIIAFVIPYIAFDLNEWYDLEKHHESEPPEVWE